MGGEEMFAVHKGREQSRPFLVFTAEGIIFFACCAHGNYVRWFLAGFKCRAENKGGTCRAATSSAAQSGATAKDPNGWIAR